ncbi:serine hydrolase domain-containing protein [candidate division KSB1 bacterium]
MFNKTVFLLLIFFIPLSDAAGFQASFQTPQSIEELQTQIGDILTEYNVPGAAIAIVSRDSTIWSGEFGKFDIVSEMDVTENTMFRMGSISKSFVSTAVLILQEQGRIDLDDIVHDLIPEFDFENRWEENHPLRVVHLLEHTSGFDELHVNEYAVHDPGISILDGLKFNMNSKVARWEPGKYYSYSNIGPTVAAYIVEKISGQRFEDFVKENIFDALDMSASGYEYTDKIRELLSKGYTGSDNRETPYEHIITRPSGSLNSSAREMANFVMMLLNKGMFNGRKILDPETVARIETPATSLAASSGLVYGYGLGNYTTPFSGFIFHGHGGDIAGFSAYYGYSQDLVGGFVICTNSETNAYFDIGERIAAFLASGHPESSIPPPPRFSEADHDRYTGWYKQHTSRQQIQYFIDRIFNSSKIYRENGLLYYKFLFGDGRVLIPVTDSMFRTENVPVANSIFILDENGDLLWLNSANYRKSNAFSVFFELGVTAISLILIFSTLFFTMIQVIRKFLKKSRSLYVMAWLFQALASLCLIGFLILLIKTLGQGFDLDTLGNLTTISFSVWALTWGFALFSVAGLVMSVRSLLSFMGKPIKTYTFLLSLANITVMLYLWYWDIIGLRTWVY